MDRLLGAIIQTETAALNAQLLRKRIRFQFEIRQYAAAAESFLERLMPVTHEAFIANGRVAP
jgi:hypothetical protein